MKLMKASFEPRSPPIFRVGIPMDAVWPLHAMQYGPPHPWIFNHAQYPWTSYRGWLSELWVASAQLGQRPRASVHVGLKRTIQEWYACYDACSRINTQSINLSTPSEFSTTTSRKMTCSELSCTFSHPTNECSLVLISQRFCLTRPGQTYHSICNLSFPTTVDSERSWVGKVGDGRLPYDIWLLARDRYKLVDQMKIYYTLLSVARFFTAPLTSNLGSCSCLFKIRDLRVVNYGWGYTFKLVIWVDSELSPDLPL